MRVILAIIMVLVAAMPVSAAEKISDSDRFRLWNNCKPVGLCVENLLKDATDIRLTKDAVTVAVRSRLRAARLYSTSCSTPFLGVRVIFFGPAYDILIRYNKWFSDPATGVSHGETTWRSGAIGTHGGDASYILSEVSMYVDHFIDEYLRVNEPACGKPD